MEINKLFIVFESYKQKQRLIETSILYYKDFIEGYYSSEVRKNNKLAGYKINCLRGDEMILASNEIVSDISFNKYAISRDTLKEISIRINNYLSIAHKIILIDVGPMLLMEPSCTNSLINFFTSDKKSIVFAKKNKEIEKTFRSLDDSIIAELSSKEFDRVKDLTDKWIGNLISRMEINE